MCAATAEAFRFKDLNARARAHAMHLYAVPNDWHKEVVEKFKQRPDWRTRGFHIDNVRFYGFGSQGDGASWRGSVWWRAYVTSRFADTPEKAAFVECINTLCSNGDMNAVSLVQLVGHCVHSNTMQLSDIDVWNTEGCVNCDSPFKGALVEHLVDAVTPMLDELRRDAQEEARAIADEMYRELADGYDSFFDAETFAETADVNDWKFDSAGNII